MINRLSNAIKNAPEIKLFDSGHTLSLLSVEGNKILACRGSADFSHLDILTGENIDKMVTIRRITEMHKCRWPILVNEPGCKGVFCTTSDGDTPNQFMYQHLHFYAMDDSYHFRHNKTMVDGSAPWYIRHDNISHLFYHKKRDKHYIYCKQASNIDGLPEAPEQLLITMDKPGYTGAFSAPCVFKLGDKFCMLTEYTEYDGFPWQTVLYVADTITGKYSECGVVLDNGRACAFPHIIGGNLIITYSRFTDHWDLRYRRINIEGI